MSAPPDVARVKEALWRRRKDHRVRPSRDDFDAIVEAARDMATVVTTSLVPCQCPRGQRAGAGVEHVADCPLMRARDLLAALDGDTQ